MSARVILAGGGARSGKSAFALERARDLGARRVFLATAQPLDDEMRARVARHVEERGAAFRTIEEPLDVPAAVAALGADVDVVVIDCITLWLSNLLCRDDPPARVLAAVDALAEVLAARQRHAVVVTNEVGLGLVPGTPLGRSFRDVAGRAHQRLADVADEVYLAVLGTILRLRPAPVVAAAPASRSVDPFLAPARSMGDEP